MVKNIPSSQTSSLLILLVAGLLLLVLYFVGMGLPESLELSHTARNVVSALNSTDPWVELTNLRSSVGIRELSVAIPLAAMYSIGGANDATTFVLPIIASLLNIVLIFLISERLYGRSAGLLASFFWMVLPVNIFTPSSLIYFQITISLALLTLWLVDSQPQPAEKKVPWLAPIFGALLVGDWVVALFTFGLAATIFMTARKHPTGWIPVALLLFSFGLAANFKLGFGFIAFYENLIDLPEMEVLLPVLFLTVVASSSRNSANRLPLMLLGISVLGIIFRFTFSPQGSLLNEPLLGLAMAATVLLLSGILSTRLDLKERLIPLASLAFVGIAMILSSMPAKLIPSYEGWDWLSIQSLVPVLKILPGLVFLALIINLVLHRHRSARVSQAAWIFTLLFTFSLIPYTWDRYQQLRPSFEAVDQAMVAVESMDLDLPIYTVSNAALQSHIDYIRKSNLKTVDLKAIADLGDASGYILYWEDAVQNPPSNWWQVGAFGRLGLPRLILARVLNPEFALQEFTAASNSLNSEQTKVSYERAYAAAINAGELCKAIRLWIQSQGHGTSSYLPLYSFDIEECANLDTGENLLLNREPIYYPGYAQINYFENKKDLVAGAAIGHKYPFFEDPRTVYLDINLQPNSVYAYHTEISGPEEAMPLYWNIDKYENYLDFDFYRTATPLTVLFSTFTYADKVSVRLSPFLYYVDLYNGTFDIKNMGLSKITLSQFEE